jgi:hypothetical protein
LTYPRTPLRSQTTVERVSAVYNRHVTHPRPSGSSIRNRLEQRQPTTSNVHNSFSSVLPIFLRCMKLQLGPRLHTPSFSSCLHTPSQKSVTGVYSANSGRPAARTHAFITTSHQHPQHTRIESTSYRLETLLCLLFVVEFHVRVAATHESHARTELIALLTRQDVGQRFHRLQYRAPCRI